MTSKVKGNIGEPLTFDRLTESQKEQLKGSKGHKGKRSMVQA